MDSQSNPDNTLTTATSRTPQMTGECSYGLHKHCSHILRYEGSTGWIMWVPCECPCHGAVPVKPRPQQEVTHG